ncbi:MAG: ParB/RepB/Spo0J family partition protein [Leptospirales bacterium]|nr:ParB/RepB/Spo0J family partition protein [Leptospirales bacterium]
MAKRVLGRGLSNLLPGESGIQIQSNPDYQELSIADVVPSPTQPRKQFDQEEIKKLAQTLHTVGLIEPIVVRRVKDKYEIISGERRFRACKLAGFKKIPAVLKQVDDLRALEMALIENIQREDLNPIEEARSYEIWMQKTGDKPSDLADRLGKDRTTITNLTRLLKLPDEIQTLLEKKTLSAGQARPLLAIADRKAALRLAARIQSENWSARRVEDEVAKIQGPETRKITIDAPRKDPNLKSLESRIRTKLGAKTELSHKKNGAGKLTIYYGNLSDLDRILHAMGIKL